MRNALVLGLWSISCVAHLSRAVCAAFISFLEFVGRAGRRWRLRLRAAAGRLAGAGDDATALDERNDFCRNPNNNINPGIISRFGYLSDASDDG